MKKIIFAAASFALLAGCSTTPTKHQYSQMNEQVKVFYKGRMAPRNYTVIRTEKNQQTVANPTKRVLTRKDFRASEKMSVYALQQAAKNAGGNAVIGTTCIARVAHDQMSANVICQGKLARVGVRTVKMAKKTQKTHANKPRTASRKATTRTKASNRKAEKHKKA